MYANLKLGKAPPRHDKRTLKLSNYIDRAKLPTAPDSRDWTTQVSGYGVMRNDSLGDCAIAGPGHMIQTWTAANGAESIPSDDAIVKAYAEVSGYDPRDGSNDNGCVMLDVLNYWRNTGIGGHKILGYALIEPHDVELVKIAINLFGGTDDGFALPITAQDQSVWDVVGDGVSGDSARYSWGGHCVPKPKYDALHPVCVTWGQRLPMTWEFFTAYCDECYAVLSTDWVNGSKTAPNGFDLDALTADLAAIH